MINSAEHVSARTNVVQRQQRYGDIAVEQLRCADSARTKPVRRSVDLSPAHHTRLTQWCAETADMIGTARVTGQDVIRALVARLLMDEALAQRIRADLSVNL
ncbi:MAG TPA: hypothetical protein VGO16_18235 [Pseudonocardiaceae bacterium]|jgi:hypothetical protein|nr:hypothetical protein [Pseudonocardiaceae bacterium]